MLPVEHNVGARLQSGQFRRLSVRKAHGKRHAPPTGEKASQFQIASESVRGLCAASTLLGGQGAKFAGFVGVVHADAHQIRHADVEGASHSSSGIGSDVVQSQFVEPDFPGGFVFATIFHAQYQHFDVGQGRIPPHAQGASRGIGRRGRGVSLGVQEIELQAGQLGQVNGHAVLRPARMEPPPIFVGVRRVRAEPEEEDQRISDGIESGVSVDEHFHGVVRRIVLGFGERLVHHRAMAGLQVFKLEHQRLLFTRDVRKGIYLLVHTRRGFVVVVVLRVLDGHVEAFSIRHVEVFEAQFQPVVSHDL